MKINLQIIEENLVQFLPEWQQAFCNTPSYKNLALALFHHLNDADDENSGLLMHSKMVFDHLCDSDPEGLLRKDQIEKRIEQEQKEIKLLNLFKEHLRIMR